MVEAFEFEDDLLRISRSSRPPGLRIEGELDAARHTVLDRLLLIAGIEHQRAHLDFSGLEFVDLGAMNLIIDHARKLPDGHVLVLDFLPPELERMFNEVPEGLLAGLIIGRSRAS
ncbi:hypothetical protein GCM10010411_80960 [Actinomadura fulvescens]|uniref:STAS domain-containing protein n=2 Tax=Actinomadura fulvescens TaxID=46160 RepID=A0ABP6CY24_9ACTN